MLVKIYALKNCNHLRKGWLPKTVENTNINTEKEETSVLTKTYANIHSFARSQTVDRFVFWRTRTETGHKPESYQVSWETAKLTGCVTEVTKIVLRSTWKRT